MKGCELRFLGYLITLIVIQIPQKNNIYFHKALLFPLQSLFPQTFSFDDCKTHLKCLKKQDLIQFSVRLEEQEWAKNPPNSRAAKRQMVRADSGAEVA